MVNLSLLVLGGIVVMSIALFAFVHFFHDATDNMNGELHLSKLHQLRRQKSVSGQPISILNKETNIVLELGEEENSNEMIPPVPIEFKGEDLSEVEEEAEEDDYDLSAAKLLPPTHLPGFAEGGSEFAFAGLLERSHLSPTYFHITTILLSKSFLRSMDIDSYKVKNESKAAWLSAFWQFDDTNYLPSGRRSHAMYWCHFHASNRSKELILPAQFVPNRGTNVLASNRKLDILRCPLMMQSTQQVLRHIERDDLMIVTLYRGDKPLLRYDIPWRRRAVGCMVDTPPSSQGLDVWQDYPARRASAPASRPLVSHLCVTCARRSLSRATAALVLENIAHHLAVGFDHILLTIPWAHTVPHTQRLAAMLASFIKEGKVTVWPVQTSSSANSVPLEIGGLLFTKIFLSTLQANLCLYLSKGVADYMLTADLDEFFVPQFNYGQNTLRALLARHVHPSQLLAGASEESVGEDMFRTRQLQGAGWADGHHHPWCHLSINTQILVPASKEREDSQDSSVGRWVGQAFVSALAAKFPGLTAANSSLIAVDRIYFAGVRSPGACSPGLLFSSCATSSVEHPNDLEGICYTPNGVMNVDKDPHLHSIDYRVTDDDARHVDAASEAVMLHVRYFQRRNLPGPDSLRDRGPYSRLWFPVVYEELSRRGLNLIVELPTEPIEDSPLPGTTNLMTVKERELGLKITMQEVDDTLLEDFSAALDTQLEVTIDPVELPRFAVDHSEFVIAGVLERAEHRHDLAVATFVLHHKAVEPKKLKDRQALLRIHPHAIVAWHSAAKAMKTTAYDELGRRVAPVQCRIHTAVAWNATTRELRHHPLSSEHLVSALSVPTALGEDYNAMGRYDIFRCLLPDDVTPQLYQHFAGQDGWSVQVELVKAGVPVIKYHISWQNRIAGFMASDVRPMHQWVEFDPAESLTHKQAWLRRRVAPLPSTGLDPWQGFDLLTRRLSGQLDKIYLCVPGWYSGLTRNNLSHLLEFLEYHLSLGVQQIFLGVSFAWDSPHMQQLYRFLDRNIRSNRITVLSQSADGVDFLFTMGGAVWHFDAVKNLYASLLVYYAKGMVEHVGVWDVDEFFVPHPPFESLGAVLDALPRGPQMGEHAPCYLELSSSTYFRVDPGVSAVEGVHLSAPPRSAGDHESTCISKTDELSVYELWLGHHYYRTAIRNNFLSHRKAIHMPARVDIVGLHTAGVCKLPINQSPCKDLQPGELRGALQLVGDACYQTKGSSSTSSARDPLVHFYNDPVLRTRDALMVNRSVYGHLYHIQFFRNINLEVQADPTWRKTAQVEWKNGSMDDNMGFLVERYMRGVWLRLAQDGLYHPLVLLHDESYVRVPHISLYAGDYNNDSSSAAAPVLARSGEKGPVLHQLPTHIQGTNHVLLSSTIVRYPFRDIFNYALVSFVTSATTIHAPKAAAAAASAPATHPIDLADYDVFCELTFDKSTYGVRGVFVRVSADLGYMRCMLSDSVMESLGMDLHVKLKLLYNKDFGRTNETTGFPHLRSIHFAIPALLVGTGLGYPVVDPSVDVENLNNQGYVQSIEQQAFSREFLFSKRAGDIDGDGNGDSNTGGGGLNNTELHVCVPSGFADITTRATVPLLLEFLQHHLRVLGVDHIYLPILHYEWTSSQWNSLLLVLRPFLQAGQLTVWAIGRYHTVRNRPDLAFPRSFTQRYSQMMCGLHGHHLDAGFMAHWRMHQFLFPAAVSAATQHTGGISSTAAQLLDLGRLVPGRRYAITRRRVYPGPALDAYWNHADRKDTERLWLGEIYNYGDGDGHDWPDIDAQDRRVGLDIYLQGWVQRFSGVASLFSQDAVHLPDDEVSAPWRPLRAVDGKTLRNESIVVTPCQASLSSAVLHDFHHLAHLHNYIVSPCKWYPSPERIMYPEVVEIVGHPIDVAEELLWRSRYRDLCRNRLRLDANHLHDQAHGSVGSSRSTALSMVSGSVYVKTAFPSVFQSLLESRLDLFVDGIPLQIADQSERLQYIKYDDVFASILSKE